MMRESHTAIVERHVRLPSQHRTEPYECGWAAEAIFFVYLTDPSGADIGVRAEISADGQRWVGTEDHAVLSAGQTGLALPVRHFGGWLRLAVDGSSTNPELDIYLALKG